MKIFDKSFTQQESIPSHGIEKAVDILKSGRLHRYNTGPGEISETALLESEYANYQGAEYCLAVTSGGQAIQIALRAAGIQPGDMILANAYTLAPVPGAIHAVGAVPVFVEIGEDWLTDLEDLRASINKVIDALGPDARSTEIRAFFDDKAEQIQRTKLDIAHHKRDLADCATPKKLQNIVQQHQRLVTRLSLWSRDPEAVAPIRQTIKRLTITTSGDRTGNVTCCADFDVQGITSLGELR